VKGLITAGKGKRKENDDKVDNIWKRRLDKQKEIIMNLRQVV
jgi:hypothetical protein